MFVYIADGYQVQLVSRLNLWHCQKAVVIITVQCADITLPTVRARREQLLPTKVAWNADTGIKI